LEKRTLSERFGIPHSFPPNLSVGEAAVAACGALARILLGSILFAVWGAYSIRSFDMISNHFWRIVVLIPLLFLFAVAFGAMMMAISAIVRKLSPPRGYARPVS
jgi:hypothetical protein